MAIFQKIRQYLSKDPTIREKTQKGEMNNNL